VRQEETVSLATYSTVVQVAHDSLPATRQVVLQEMLTSETWMGVDVSATTTDIASATKYPTSSTRRFLQELAAVGLATRITSDMNGKADSWRASPELLALKNDIMKPYAEAVELPRFGRR
jgi:predicted transcriptional regulator